MTTTIHTFSLGLETEKIFLETQFLCRGKRTNLSKEISNFIIELHGKLTKPIQVKDTITLDSFSIFEKFLKEDVARLTWHQRREFSIAFNERRWELEHIQAALSKDKKIQEQDAKEILETRDKKKFPIKERVIELKEEVVEEEVIK